MSTSPHKFEVSKEATFAEALAIQIRVIGALILRELHTRYGRENVGYLWVIGDPMMLAGALAIIHGSERQNYFGTHMPVIPFTIVGYCTFIIFRGVFGRSAAALESNLPLLYHRVITIFDILASRAILEYIGISATMVILLTISCLVGFSDWPYRPLHLLLSTVLMTWFALGVGMLTCAAVHLSRIAERLVHPVSYLLMPLSGAFFILEWIPDPYQTLLSYFPMTLILEEARYGMFITAKDTFVDLPYIISANLFLTACGLLAIKVTRRHIYLT